MKNLLYIFIFSSFSIIYPLKCKYTPIYNPQSLKKEVSIKLAQSFVTHDLKNLMEKIEPKDIERKQVPQELIDNIKKELVNENLLLYLDIFSDLIEPQKADIEGFVELKFNHDNTLLLGVNADRIVVYAWPSLKVKNIIKHEQPERVLSAAVVPYSNILVTAHKEKICVWDFELGICIKEIKKDPDLFCDLAISKTGKTLIIRSETLLDDSRRYYQLSLQPVIGDTLEDICRCVLSDEALTYLRFTPNENYFLELVGNLLCLYHTPFPFFPIVIDLKKKYGSSLALSSSGSFVLTLAGSMGGKSLYHCDISKGYEIIEPALFSTPIPMDWLALSPDDKFCVMSDIHNHLWFCTSFLDTWTKTKKPLPLVSVRGLKWALDGTILIFGINKESKSEKYLYQIYKTLEPLLSLKEMVLIAKLHKEGLKLLSNPYYNSLLKHSRYCNLLMTYFKIEKQHFTMIH